MIPGEFIAGSTAVEINSGLNSKKIKVLNMGDRPIQVGSHFHFFEVNKFLSFSRDDAFGYRLDTPSGTAVRFEPGEAKEVRLVEIGGKRRIRGHNNLTDAQINDSTRKISSAKADTGDFKMREEHKK